MIESGFYATEQDEMMVVFGGSILLDGSIEWNDETGEQYRELAMYYNGKKYDIGGEVDQSERIGFDDYHPIRLRFYDNRSIDVLINILKELKSLKKENQ